MANLGWFTQDQKVAGVDEFSMFGAARNQEANMQPAIKKKGMTVAQMPAQLKELMKKSLKSNRWDAINLGKNSNYTNDNMVGRWVIEKNKWLTQRNAGEDVRGTVTSAPIPDKNSEKHSAVRRTMKATNGPYGAFAQYHPLEDTVLLYDAIWNESDSSDEE